MGTKNKSLENKEHKGFTSKLGFVLAAAGSAVGLGNLWRFPYLTAKYGGGIFLLCYIVLAVVLGCALLMLEFSIGRKTRKSVIGAFSTLNKKFSWVGYFSLIVPAIIVPFYCVIGGWVIKYVISFITGASGLVGATDTSSFFTTFRASTFEPLLYFFIFAFITVLIIAFGVQKGIEKLSKIMMPALAVISVGLMIYVLCQPKAMEGVAFFFLPDFSKFSFQTVLAALGQLFYSMSIGLCINITYGSYMKKDTSIPSSSGQVALFDSSFAIVAGLIIIPAIFAFSQDPYTVIKTQGTSLMFIQLTQVFNNIPAGSVVGAIFFILVFFAALTSSISLVEALVAAICEKAKISRTSACIIVFALILILGALSSLGFGVLSNVRIFGLGIMDTFDFLSNNILIPIVAIITCVVAGYFINKELLPDEIGIGKNRFLKSYFNIVVRYVAPICILIILISGLFLTI